MLNGASSAAAPSEVGILKLQEVAKWYPIQKGIALKRTVGHVRAVDGVSLEVMHGETIGLVGESGCGKTTTGKLILRLEAPTGGQVFFEGLDLNRMSSAEVRDYRRKVQAVFQDPMASLSPRMKVGSIIAEPMIMNLGLPRNEILERVGAAMEAVGLDPSAAPMYPHEFSGGQRQRIAIARAISVNPKLLVLDEPVSSLDISIQAQVINLLKRIQEEHHLTYLLIAHNLGTVRYLTHRIAVMYLGQIVEEAPTEEFFNSPMHPYSKALLSAAMPIRPKDSREAIVLSGEVPSPANPPQGCRFHPRCPSAMPQCSRVAPTLRENAPDHMVSCHLYDG
ncbi:MAG: ABC transporter ATP-binding protein [Chloroflexi bacterium]|nr:ABC transporter ATP-binding protein [Chloroflexota bacterium]